MSSTPGAVLLQADNFTPLSRTPWAGTKLRAAYKRDADVRPELRAQLRVGESWEVSVEPDFPSCTSAGEALSTWLAHDFAARLGAEHVAGRTGTALLVKLIDTAEPLSLQIHPADDYVGLAAGEAGKPETWYVVEREPGAGLYLGFEPFVGPERVRKAIEGGESLEPLMRFVPVEPGDFFVIDAGTPHAIGKGLLLVEPQHVVAGKRGVTYRYWDWNRRYDNQGCADPNGAPRQLHVGHALSVTNWLRVVDPGFVHVIRRRAGEARPQAGALLERLCGPGGPDDGLASDFLRVWRCHGSGTLRLNHTGTLRALTVLQGHITLRGVGEDVVVEAGRSAVIAAASEGVQLELEASHAIVSSIVA